MWVYWVILTSVCVASYFICMGFLPKYIALLTSTTTFILGLLFPILQSKLLLWQTTLLISVLLLFSGYLANKYLQRCTKQPEPCSPESFAADNEIQKDNPALEVSPKQVELPEPSTEDVLQPESGEKIGQGKSLGEILTDEINNEQSLDQTAVEEVAPVYSDDEVETYIENELEVLIDNIPEAESISLFKIPPGKKLSENTSHEPDLENSPEQETRQEKVCQEEVSTVDMQGKETKNEVPPNDPYQSILAEGLLFKRNREFSKAVHCFRKVISLNPPQELLCLVINELSSVYQHLGLYSMASDIIELFIEQPTLKSHPGAENLRQKKKFINILSKLLKGYRLKNVAYEQIPKAVLEEAFRKSQDKN